MKRILIFGLSSSYAGVEALILNYVNQLKEAEYDVDFVVAEKEPDYLKEKLVRCAKAKVVPNRVKNLLKYYKTVDEIVKNGNYDIVWCNFCTLTDIQILKAAKKYNVPTRIAHSHNSENMGNFLVLITHLLNKKKINKYANKFYACSDFAGEFMFGKQIMQKKNYKVIPNAIDAQMYDFNAEIRSKVRENLCIADKIVIGHVGRFHFQKNHKLLIKIFKAFSDNHPDSVLVLVGTGGLMDEIKNMVENLKIDDKVFFLGNRKDVNELMQGMDLMLFPSLFEGLPVTLVEAQTAGLPCVIADTISPQTKITDLVTFEKLDAGIEDWVKDMDNALKRERRSRFAEMKEAGFDVRSQTGEIFD